MLDDYFTKAEILRRHRAGFFGAYLDSYTSLVRDQGYPRQTIRSHCYLFRVFGRWLVNRRLALGDIDEKIIEKFYTATRRVPLVRSVKTKPIRVLIEHLRKLGLVPVAVSPSLAPAEAMAQRYGEYLDQRRALLKETVSRHVAFVRQFLVHRFGTRPLRLRELRERDVTGFVLNDVQSFAPRTAQTLMSILRSFFRFLLEQSEIDVDLVGAVPVVANWRLADVPKYISRPQVDSVLAACDRNTPKGRRDLAILLLLARLGVRSCEVARLELDDINWRAGELTIRGKGRKVDQLPLLAEVGKALAEYIKRDRPECGTRRVFTRVRAPITGLALKGSVTTVVRAAMRRAKLDAPVFGAHVLRHTLATTMLREGASMAEVGVLLRHESNNTTEIYAKVDLTSLRRLAQPWPVGGRQ